MKFIHFKKNLVYNFEVEFRLLVSQTNPYHVAEHAVTGIKRSLSDPEL